MPRTLHKTILQAGIAGSFLFASAVQAHFPWLAIPAFTPAEGKKVPIFFIYGHTFPIDTFLRKDRIVGLDMIMPDGTKTALEMNESGYFDSPKLLSEGSYVFLGSQKDLFWTRTKNGNKSKSKEGLTDVITCTHFTNSMKSILNVGSGNGDIEKVYGQPLEIIPLKNPADLKIGDYMDIQVILRGEPYNGLVFATYAGFGGSNVYAYTTTTDNEGKASIRMLSNGPWLIKVKAENHPYPDSKICDLEGHFSTLTFGIQ